LAKRLGPIPKELKLASTLAQRLFQLREFRNLTVRDLARASRFSVIRIEELEAGMETWLSATDRQLLAKALNVEANVLQEVESRPTLSSTTESKDYVPDRRREIIRAIINGARDLECPECNGALKCSIQQGLDMDNNEVSVARAFCIKCPFVIHG
jgi:transcriptional regulator with XRE-family HTH domain